MVLVLPKQLQTAAHTAMQLLIQLSPRLLMQVEAVVNAATQLPQMQLEEVVNAVEVLLPVLLVQL